MGAHVDPLRKVNVEKKVRASHGRLADVAARGQSEQTGALHRAEELARYLAKHNRSAGFGMNPIGIRPRVPRQPGASERAARPRAIVAPSHRALASELLRVAGLLFGVKRT